jgi:hypothetical protein
MKSKMNGIAQVATALIGVFAIYCNAARADDVVLPATPPAPTRIEYIAQNRTEACRTMRSLSQSKIMILSQEGKDDFATICGDNSSSDQERLGAVDRLQTGLLLVDRSTGVVEKLEKITSAVIPLTNLDGPLRFAGPAEQAVDNQLFSVGTAD